MTTFCDPASERAFDGLVEMFAGGRVLGLVGAGSSVRVGYPSWSGLLDGLRSRSLERASAEAVAAVDLQQDSLVRAGDYRRLLGDGYPAFIAQTFGPRTPQFARFHTDIVTLPFRHVLTTNYDPVLDAAHREVFGNSPTVVDVKDNADLATFMDDVGSAPGYGQRYHVHLHGRYDAPSSVVLTEQDYLDRYERSASTPLALVSLLATQRLLAIGFSLSDVDVLQLFRSVRARLHRGPARHFALLGLSEVARAAPERSRLMEKYGVEPIFYPVTDGHAALDALVARLGELLRGAYPRLFEPREVRYVHRLPAPVAIVGRDRELAMLGERLARPSPAVVSLVGPPGSGKRTLADAFLRTLVEPSVLPARGLLWSFRDIWRGAYDLRTGPERPDPVYEFARAAYRLCTGQSLPRTVESPFGHLLDALQTAGRIVLVLDGLDEVARADGGQISLPRELQTMLEHLAAGRSHAFAVITTTVPIRLPPGPFAETIDVSRLPLDAAARVLGAREAPGEPDDLARRLADLVGCHAKAIELLRSLIAEAYGGDRERALAFLERADVGSRSPETCVTSLLAEHLAHLEEGAARLLRGLSRGLYPLTLPSLSALYAPPARGADGSFARLAVDELDRLVLILVRRGMLRAYAGARRALYAWEPASRPLLASLPAGLEARPIGPEEQADLISDLTAAAFPREAYLLYRRLGGRLLGAGAHLVGERATRALLRQGDPRRPVEGLSAEQEGIVLSDRGVFLHGLGRLDEAIRVHELSKERDWQSPTQLAWDDLRLAGVHMSRGSLAIARRLLLDVCRRAEDGEHYNLELLARTRYAEVTILAGDLREARRALARVAAVQEVGSPGELYGAPGLAQARFLLRRGKLEAARRLVVANRKYCREHRREADVLICDLQLAEIEAGAGQPVRAAARAGRARRAAEARGWLEAACRARLIAASALGARGRHAAARDQIELALAESRGLGLVEADALNALARSAIADDRARAEAGAQRAL